MSYPPIPYTTTPTGITSNSDYNYGLSYDGNGNIWISNTILGIISIIDVTTNTTTQISTTSLYSELKYPDSIIYDPVNNYMWITDHGDSIIVIVTANNPYTVKKILNLSYVDSIAFDNKNNNMWALDEYNKFSLYNKCNNT